jgi:branched-chain amino acid transport system permease protein
MAVDRRILSVIAIAVLAVLPLLGLGAYIQHLLVLWMLFALMAISLNIIVGYLGELSFGHAAFFAIGAYASAMISVFAGLPFWIGLVAAPIASGLLGLVIGYVSLRIKGPQFAILTLGFGAILHSIFNNWMEVTNGPLGITRIPPPRLSGVDFGTATAYFYLVLIFVVAAMYLCHTLISSPPAAPSSPSARTTRSPPRSGSTSSASSCWDSCLPP